MELLAYTINGQIIGIDIGVWSDTELSGNTAFMAIIDGGTIPTDYVDISSIVYWDAFGGMTTLDDTEIKSEIVKLISDTPTLDEFQILENYATVGLNSMTNIDNNITMGSVLSDGHLSGVTDTKFATSGGTLGTIAGDDGTLNIDGNIGVGGSSTVGGNSIVGGSSIVGGNITVTGDMTVSGTIDNPATTGATTGATNVGTGEGLYTGVTNYSLQLKTLIAGTNVTLVPDDNSITINASGGGTSIYGSEYQIAVSLDSSTTSATTPQTKVTLNTTTLPTGTYKITVAWMALHNSDKSDMRFDVNFNGTAEGTTVQIESKDVTSVHPFIRIFYLALNGTNTISLRYWNEGNSTTISDATIELIRVS